MKNYLAMPVERIPSARDKSGIFDNSNQALILRENGEIPKNILEE